MILSYYIIVHLALIINFFINNNKTIFLINYVILTIFIFVIYFFVSGVTITELFISMFCFANVLLVVHLIFPIVNTYVFFSNPIELTNGLIVYAILLILLGWLGFLFGMYKII